MSGNVISGSHVGVVLYCFGKVHNLVINQQLEKRESVESISPRGAACQLLSLPRLLSKCSSGPYEKLPGPSGLLHRLQVLILVSGRDK